MRPVARKAKSCPESARPGFSAGRQARARKRAAAVLAFLWRHQRFARRLERLVAVVVTARHVRLWQDSALLYVLFCELCRSCENYRKSPALIESQLAACRTRPVRGKGRAHLLLGGFTVVG